MHVFISNIVNGVLLTESDKAIRFYWAGLHNAKRAEPAAKIIKFESSTDVLCDLTQVT